MTIFFFSQTEPYAEFSNFAKFGVELEGAYWPTVEHYFQAKKFADPTYREFIRNVSKPKDAARLGRTREHPLRSDWEEVKDGIMYDACLKKFQTHEVPRDLLLETGDEHIVEDAPMDYYWGCGADGSGLNKLGHILVRIRGEIREIQRTGSDKV